MARLYDSQVDQAITAAHQLAVTRHNYQLDIPHLWSVLIQPASFAANFYQQLGVNLDRMQAVVEQELEKLPHFEQSDQSRFGKTYSQRLKKLIDQAAQYQTDFGDVAITIGHLILALNQQASNPITIFLHAQLVNEDKLLAALDKVKPAAAQSTGILQKYTQELTHGDDELTIIGRQRELQDLIRVLNRQKKIMPFLWARLELGNGRLLRPSLINFS